VTPDAIRIRPATDDDREALTRVFDTANPAWATSAAQYRRGPRPEPTNGISVVAERAGQIVGAARSNEALEGLLPRPGMFSARVAVDPCAVGQRVGSRLWATLREWLGAQSHRKEVFSWADRDDQRTVAIAAHWHFSRRPGSIEDPADLNGDEPWAWNHELKLDPDRIEPPTGAPPGITISPLADVLGDRPLVESLHEAHEECRADVPAWEPYEPIPLQEFIVTQQQRLADGGFGIVAHRNGEVLAGTFAERSAFVPTVHNDFTMVRRSTRGQGLALTVKRRLIEEATAEGIQRITTEVRTDNKPMLAVNAALGFRRIAVRHLSREL
jgi:GNAT superfamily N-acetyltransferase